MNDSPFPEAAMNKVADSLRAELDRRWMEAITFGPAVADYDRGVSTQTVTFNTTPSKALDLATLDATIKEFEDRFHRKDVEMFSALFAAGVMVVADPFLDGDQMVLRVGRGRDRAIREALEQHFKKAPKA